MLQVSALFKHIYIVVNSSFWGSSLIYNTSARHVRHECDTSDTNVTRVRHECDKSETRATRVWHKCDTSTTRTTRVRHDWKILISITTQIKTFSHPYFYYMASERIQGEEQFHSRTIFWKCLVSMPKCV